jgi:hypothetical protein
MSFLITISNQSDERKEQQKEPKFEEKRLFLRQGVSTRSHLWIAAEVSPVPISFMSQ